MKISFFYLFKNFKWYLYDLIIFMNAKENDELVAIMGNSL